MESSLAPSQEAAELTTRPSKCSQAALRKPVPLFFSLTREETPAQSQVTPKPAMSPWVLERPLLL